MSQRHWSITVDTYNGRNCDYEAELLRWTDNPQPQYLDRAGRWAFRDSTEVAATEQAWKELKAQVYVFRPRWRANHRPKTTRRHHWWAPKV